VREFFAHLVEMPRSHKIVLTLATLLAACGAAGVVTRKAEVATTATVSSATGSQQQQQQQSPSGPSRGFVSSDSGSSSASTPAPTPAPAPPPPTLTERISPHAMHVGLGMIGGFVIGWAFRAFLKMMATITFFVAVIFFGLSYFNILNVDFSAAQTKFKSQTEWVSDQASRAKDAAMTHVPGGASSLIGLWLGFRRK
jgi:uncharacterized membrane protein (Fun14 family)